MMRKPFYTTVISLAVIIFFTLAFQACRRTSDSFATNAPGPLSVTTAKKYFKEITKTAGREVPKKFFTNSADSANSKPNKKYIMWKKAYTSQTNQFDFVEAPLYYNQKVSSVLRKDDEPIDQEVKRKIFGASLTRLVVYKDKKTGVFGQYIVNYIPDISYLEKHKYDISHNQINKIDKDFTGYIKYMTWDGEPRAVFKLKNGKVVSKGNYMKEIIDGKTVRNLSSNDPAAKQKCMLVAEDVYSAQCWVSDPETNAITCEATYLYSTMYTLCFEVEETYDVCANAGAGEFFIECYYGPNPPTGGGEPGGSSPPGGDSPFYPQQMNFLSGSVTNLSQLFNCFANVNNNAIYTLKLCVDIPSASMWPLLINPVNKQPGHTFLTITKTYGNNSVTQSFGFYPNDGIYGITASAPSKMVNDGGHEYDAYMEKTMYSPDFDALVNLTMNLVGYPYTINAINDTDVALYLFNSVVRPWSQNYPPVVVPDHTTQPPSGGEDNYGKTPNMLYHVLYMMASTNNAVHIGTSNAPAGSGLCP